MRILTLCLSGLIVAGVLASAGTASAKFLPRSITRQQCIEGGGVPFFEECRGGIYNGQSIIPGT